MAYIQNIASFFARKCSADYQRNALAEMLRQSSICATMPADVLAKRLEISPGKVRIASPFSTSSQHLCYTPETYILHPENILRLMEEYENYYSIPYENNIQGNYNLFANMDGLALLVRNAFPPLMIEITRPEIVMTCREYLLRKAERIGYDGIQKTKHYLKIKDLIRNLKEQL